MTELRESIDRLSESEHQLRLVTDNAPVGTAQFDADLRYKFMNRRHAERLKERLGLAPQQVIGRRVPEVFGDKLFAVFEPHIRECLAGNAVEFEVELPFQIGEPSFLQCRLEPEWSGGKVIGLVAAGTDITRLKRAEINLRESKDRLQFALDAAQLGWWHYDPFRGVISGDSRSKELFDVLGDDIPIEDIVTKRLHSHDAERVWIAFQAALDPADPTPYATQYRIQRTDGEVRWVEAHGLAHFEGAGRERRAVSIVGTVHDITERKEREEKEHLLMREVNAQAIGLALHELATNAGKYGSLSTESGRVDVSWRIANATFTMRWTERDGPPVSAPQRRGFGTTVMEAMAARSVDGEVKLDYAPAGLAWRLTCHAANALDSEP